MRRTTAGEVDALGRYLREQKRGVFVSKMVDVECKTNQKGHFRAYVAFKCTKIALAPLHSTRTGREQRATALAPLHSLGTE